MKVSLKFSTIYILSTLWCWALYPHLLPGGPWLMLMATSLTALCFHHFYHNKTIDFEFSKEDILAVGIVFAALLILAGKWLGMSASNDEPHHYDRALFLLRAISEWIGNWPELSRQAAESDPWNALDLRILPAADLWRIASVIFLGLCGLGVWIFRKLETFGGPTRQVGQFLLLAFFSGLLLQVQPEIDNHPPLRIFPVFLSAVIWGLTDFAPRLMNLLLLALASVLLVKSTLERGSAKNTGILAAGALLISCIPSVFYSSFVIEASLYGFLGWTFTLWACERTIRTKKPQAIETALLLLPIFALFRHSVIFVLPLAFGVWIHNQWSTDRNLKRIAKEVVTVFGPWIMAGPYFYLLFQMGNGVTRGNNTAWDQAQMILTSGYSWGSVINHHFPLWIALAVLVGLVGFIKIKSIRIPLLYFPVSYFLFHFPLAPPTWAIGRYHAEFFAPYLALAIALVLVPFFMNRKTLGILLVLIFAFSSRQLVDLATTDTFITVTDDQRLINTTNMPFDQAARAARQGGLEHRFVFLGGIPSEFESLLWNNGFSIPETRRWLKIQKAVSQASYAGAPWTEIKSFLLGQNVKTIYLQGQSPREMKSRGKNMQKVIDDLTLERTSGQIHSGKVFQGPQGGTLTELRIN